MTGRHAEAIELGEQIVARTRAPIFVGVQAMVFGRAGRLDEARRLGEELYERAGRGEYVSPASLLALALGLGDAALVSGASPPAPTAERRRSGWWRPTAGCSIRCAAGRRRSIRLVDSILDNARPV